MTGIWSATSTASGHCPLDKCDIARASAAARSFYLARSVAAATQRDRSGGDLSATPYTTARSTVAMSPSVSSPPKRTISRVFWAPEPS